MNAKSLKALSFSAVIAVFTMPVSAAQLQVLKGQVPAAVSRLKLRPVGSLPSAQILQLNLMLPPRDATGLQTFLQELQNPASTNYHHYLTPAQFDARFAPTEADYQAVIQFAEAHGLTVTHTVPGRTIVEVEGKVADIEQALHVKMRLYNHPTENRQFYAPDAAPTLELGVPLVAISGLDNYRLHGTRVQVNESFNSNSMIHATGSYPVGGLFMGNDFRHAFASDTSLNGSGQTVAVLEWNSFTPADISKYEAVAGLPNVNVVEVRVNGVSQNLNNGDLEVPLDIEMVMSIAPGVSKIIVIHGNDYDSILTEASDPTQGEGLPLQIGCSIFATASANTPNILARFAAQGQTFFYASGDIGAFPVEPSPSGYIPGEGSTDTQGYMVQCGGTELVMNGNGATYNSESVWSGSSGGYQTPLSTPPFQQQINLASLGGSSVYRNLPDVAAPGDNILVFCSNGSGLTTNDVLGTSCAAPLWAGFAALVNQQAQAQGKPSLGYANPAIYAVAQTSRYTACFHDITSGNNTNSRSPTLYFAAPGYDLCTGWGSPNGQSLINALTDMAGPVFVDFNYTGATQNGQYETPYHTLAQGVSGVASYGTIFIKTAGTSAETMTITKPMSIRASDGAATIGH